MRKQLREEIGTSIAESIKSIVFVELGTLLENKPGSLIVLFPEAGAQTIMKWMKSVSRTPIFSENSEQLKSLSARFSGNTVLNSMYSAVNKLKNKEITDEDASAAREKEVIRLLSRAGRNIQSKLTEADRELFMKLTAALKTPALAVVTALNKSIEGSTNIEVPEEKPEETPEKTPDDSTAETPPESKEEPSEKPPSKEKSAPVEKKPVPKEKPKEEPTVEKPVVKPMKKEPTANEKDEEVPKSSEKTDESKRVSIALDRLIREELTRTLREFTMDGEFKWRELSTEVRGVITLPNGIVIDTKKMVIVVSEPTIIRKVDELIMKKVIFPIQYRKANDVLTFKYKGIDEEQLGEVLFQLN